MFRVKEPVPLNQAHREHLKEMVRGLFPECTHTSVGGEYLSLSKTPKSNFDIMGIRIHWLEFLLCYALREIHQRGMYSDNWKLYDDNWMAGITKKIINALQSPDNRHPLIVIYEEYLKVTDAKNR